MNNNRLEEISLDIQLLNMMCRYITSKNLTVRRGQLINMRNFIYGIDPSAYNNDADKQSRVDFIKKGLEARLEYNLTNPYTIINRGISFNRSDYLTSVKKSLKGNITPFLDFSLDTVKKEIQILIKLHLLRKEYNLTNEECETTELLLKSPKKTLPGLYNSFYYQKGINDKRLIVKKLLQLLEKNVVSYDKDTKEITLLDTKESKKGYRRSYESGQNRKFY